MDKQTGFEGLDFGKQLPNRIPAQSHKQRRLSPRPAQRERFGDEGDTTKADGISLALGSEELAARNRDLAGMDEFEQENDKLRSHGYRREPKFKKDAPSERQKAYHEMVEDNKDRMEDVNEDTAEARNQMYADIIARRDEKNDQFRDFSTGLGKQVSETASLSDDDLARRELEHMHHDISEPAVKSLERDYENALEAVDDLQASLM